MEARMLRKLALMSAVSVVALGGAFAQTTDRPATGSSSTAQTEMKSGDAKFVAAQKPDQFLASKFKGTDVMGADDQKVGDVSDILFDKTGKIEAYVVSVGGFLGMGAKEVAMAPEAFQVVPGDKSSATGSSPKLKISMSKDELKNAANFEPYREPRATTGAGPGGGGTTRPSPGGMNR
jgi:sporulation protein YlmC with PRC-barrel domain